MLERAEQAWKRGENIDIKHTEALWRRRPSGDNDACLDSMLASALSWGAVAAARDIAEKAMRNLRATILKGVQVRTDKKINGLRMAGKQ
jgi:hypothetical protein